MLSIKFGKNSSLLMTRHMSQTIAGGVIVTHQRVGTKPTPFSQRELPEKAELTQKLMETIKASRLQDPHQNTVRILAKKYKVSPIDVMNTVSAPEERRQKLRQEFEQKNVSNRERLQEWKRRHRDLDMKELAERKAKNVAKQSTSLELDTRIVIHPSRRDLDYHRRLLETYKQSVKYGRTMNIPRPISKRKQKNDEEMALVMKRKELTKRRHELAEKDKHHTTDEYQAWRENVSSITQKVLEQYNNSE